MSTSAPYTPPPVKPRSGFMQFLITVLGVIVGMFLFFILLFMAFGALGAALASGEDDGIGKNTILSIDLRTPHLDHSTGAPLFGVEPPSIVKTVRAIRTASTDEDISGIFVRGGLMGMAPASSDELADALSDFKESGKFVVGFAQGFENTTLTSYAPLAATELWQQATTGFAVSGIRSEAEYLKGTFDKIGAEPQFAQFYEYKAAADTYDETTMTAPVREATTALITSIFDTLLTDIAGDRDMSVADVRAVLERAPITAEDAQAAGMIDTLGYLEEAKDRARELAGDEDAKFVSITDYKPANGKFSDPTIAFIGGQGGVVTGEGGGGANPFSVNPVIASDTISKAFDDAAENDKVKAIVFRVSSPGGSAAASDQIHAAVARAQEMGKPVVVSMGQYAASGGYYVAANADHIVAMPTTITGSIGVLGGKVALQDAFAKVGYNVEHVDVGGPYTGVFSADTPFSEYQAQGWYDQMEDIYEDFTALVAEGRGLPLAKVQEVAKGRVWTGTQALEHGLVDELGGIDTAIAKARELAEIDEDDTIYLKRYPKQLTPEEQLSRLFQVSADASADLAAISAIAQTEEVKAILRAREAMSPQMELRARLPLLDK